MAYQKTNWNTAPLSKTNMNKIETELKYLDDCNTLQLPETEIPLNADLNNYITVGAYKSTSASVTDTLTNCPLTGAGFKLIVEKNHGDQRYTQTIHSNTLTSQIFVRTYTGSWGEWQKMVLTPVSALTPGSLTSDVGHFQSGGNYNWCKRSGNVVSFFFSIIIDTEITNGWTQALVTFPTGFRPNNYTLMTMAVGNQGGTTNNYTNVVVAANPNGNFNGEWKLKVGDKLQLGGCFII